MAETVLSMARSLVGSAISKATSAAAHEASLLLGVQKDIWCVLHENLTRSFHLRFRFIDCQFQPKYVRQNYC
jgi:disease resistance protein RPM1